MGEWEGEGAGVSPQHTRGKSLPLPASPALQGHSSLGGRPGGVPFGAGAGVAQGGSHPERGRDPGASGAGAAGGAGLGGARGPPRGGSGEQLRAGLGVPDTPDSPSLPLCPGFRTDWIVLGEISLILPHPLHHHFGFSGLL